VPLFKLVRCDIDDKVIDLNPPMGMVRAKPSRDAPGVVPTSTQDLGEDQGGVTAAPCGKLVERDS
jgi:hypothetical protein